MTRPPTQQQGHSDEFQTPSYAVDPLIPYLPAGARIWEPAASTGLMARALEQRGFIVYATRNDFLSCEPPVFFGAEVIVTNPPYTIKNEFLEHAYSLGLPFAFLMPYTTLETERRQALFRRYGVELIFFNRRVNFITPSGKGSGSWFPTLWLTWGLNIGKALTFERMERTGEHDYHGVI